MATAVQTPTPVAPHVAYATPAPPCPFFEAFALPASNQRVLGAPHEAGTVSPLALRPTSAVTKSETAAHLRALQADGTLTTLLAKHGAILLRGVPVSNAEDFSELTHALGFAPHEIIGIVVDRPLLAPNVAPANESAPHVLIYNHNESPQVPHAPEYVGFYAHVAAKVGGETPISSSIELFHRAQAEIPDFIDLLAQKGVLSRVTYKPEAQYKGGSTLRDAFGKEWVEGDDEETRKRKVEEQIERYGRGEYTTYEWSTDGSLVLTHRIPALRRHALTGLPTLFTGLAAYLIRARTNPHALVAKQYYGDGTVIEDAYLEKLVEITDNWQQGDVLVFDNVAAQHGRRPWVGVQSDRIVHASLWDGAVPLPYGGHEWERLVKPVN